MNELEFIWIPPTNGGGILADMICSQNLITL